MKLPCSNKYITLNIFNYFVFLANIGFFIYLYFLNNEIPIAPDDILFLVFYYYRFVTPICIIIILIYIFYEHKIYKLINSKLQNIVTMINILLLIFILLLFVLCIIFIAYIAQGLDM